MIAFHLQANLGEISYNNITNKIFLLNKKNVMCTMRFTITAINPPARIIQSWRLFLGEVTDFLPLSNSCHPLFEFSSFDERELIGVFAILASASFPFSHPRKSFNDLAPLKNVFLAIESFLPFSFFSHISQEQASRAIKTDFLLSDIWEIYSHPSLSSNFIKESNWHRFIVINLPRSSSRIRAIFNR